MNTFDLKKFLVENHLTSNSSQQILDLARRFSGDHPQYLLPQTIKYEEIDQEGGYFLTFHLHLPPPFVKYMDDVVYELESQTYSGNPGAEFARVSAYPIPSRGRIEVSVRGGYDI